MLHRGFSATKRRIQFSTEMSFNFREDLLPLREFAAYVDHIFIPHAPNKNPSDVVNAAARLIDHQFKPVPHLPAR